MLQWCVAAAALLLGGAVLAEADDDDRHDRGAAPSRLRGFIGQQVGGVDKLKVPARHADVPVPPGPAVQPDRYDTTEAKRFLGKMLFHDPVRTVRININQGVPVDLPAGTAFGGTLSGADLARVPTIVAATRQTGSCGTCHFGEAASKAGQQINLHVGAEGRGYTDAKGNFVVRRRTLDALVKKRNAPVFPGDTLVDALPTLTDIDIIQGRRVVTTPAPFAHDPRPEALLATGRLDELDSVGRMSMSLIGLAFNNRLLFGGFAGEPPTTPGSLNPFIPGIGDPAAENIALLLLDAHRMIGEQSTELRKLPAYVKLFQDAFPKEAAAAGNDLTKLINDETVFRATATFMRTVVTRNTPFDRFIAGDDHALTAAQRRGARLFFTPATRGGAGCVACHSGPMFNKQVNDPDVAGIGRFVEENFINVGIGDHPVQALNALAKGRLDPSRKGTDGFAYHAEDTGRQEITGNPEHAFRFRSLTLRQLKDGGNFFHNGSFTRLRDVVEYFNAGVPQDPTAGAAPTLDARFTHPRGAGTPRGLGLSRSQVDDLTDFLENGLYDPAFVKFDPSSTTDTFQPSPRDLSYSRYRPDLVQVSGGMLKDGFMPSGLPVDNNDPLSRRDLGLEFLDVTSQAVAFQVRSQIHGPRQSDVVRITNNGITAIDTHLIAVVKGLPRHARLRNASGVTKRGEPYVRLFLDEGLLQSGRSVQVELDFARHDFVRHGHAGRLNYRLEMLSGQGQP
jgi:cytochrome c peroxidase